MKFKIGKKYLTSYSDAEYVEILAIDKRLPQPIVGIVIDDDFAWVRCWHTNGRYFDKIHTHPMDLVNEYKEKCLNDKKDRK